MPMSARADRSALSHTSNVVMVRKPIRAYTDLPMSLACSVAGKLGRQRVAAQVTASP